MKKIILLTIVFSACIFSYSYAQRNLSESLKSRFQPSIDSLEIRINYLISQDYLLSKMKGLKQIHILYLSVGDSLEKKNFLDNSFLDMIYPNYYALKQENIYILKRKRNISYLRTYTIICDSNYNKIAGVDGDAIYIYKNRIPLYSNIVKLFEEGKFDIIFSLGMSNVYICIKDNDVFVLKETKDTGSIYSIKEFAECCYKELCPWCERNKLIQKEKKRQLETILNK